MKLFLFITLIACSLTIFAQKFVKDNFETQASKIKISYISDFTTFCFIEEPNHEFNIKTYKGKPFKNEIKGTVYFNPIDYFKQDSNGYSNIFNLNSMYYYLDTNNWNLSIDDTNFYVLGINVNIKLQNEKVEKMFQPFYFKKYEVTNKEYREFVEWVRDSIAMRMCIRNGLSEFQITPQGINPNNVDEMTVPLNWKKRNELWKEKDQEISLAIMDMFFRRQDALYGHHTLDTRKFVYRYTDDNGEYNMIPVYPDTLVYFYYLVYPQIEKTMRLYFSLPEYDDYPVTGIDYYQAKAFCYWKQQQLKAQISPDLHYEIQVDLPNAYEWNFAATHYNDRYENVNFLPDLFVGNFVSSFVDEINTQICNNYPYFSKEDDYWITHPADIEKLYKNSKNKRNFNKILLLNLSNDGISGMGDNVSEWLNETYKDNWLPVYKKHQQIRNSLYFDGLDSSKTYFLSEFLTKFCNLHVDYDPKIEKYKIKHLKDIYDEIVNYEKNINEINKIEDAFNQTFDSNSVMVVGANWHDNRNSLNRNIYDKYFYNKSGISAKTFFNPKKSSGMIGFRYVVRIKLKNN